MTESTFSLEVQVNLRMGLHIRPCTIIAKAANEYPCQSTLTGEERHADCKSPIEIMGLGATQGTQLLLETKGEQAEEALRELAELFVANFGIDDEEELAGM